MKLILYGTSACHLCELAEHYIDAAIKQRTSPDALTFEKVDIALDDELLSLYGLIIPVLHRVDIKMQLAWPFTEEEINVMLLTCPQ